MNDRPEHEEEREFTRKREKLNLNVVSFSHPGHAAQGAHGPGQPLIPVESNSERTEREEGGRGKNGRHNPSVEEKEGS